MYPALTRLISFLRQRFEKIIKNEERFVFGVSLLFYFLVYFSPNNKILLGLFLVFLVFFLAKFKNLKISLLIMYLLFLSFEKGKTFSFVLIPSWLTGRGVPYNYDFTITFSDIACLGLVALFLREEILSRWKIRVLKAEKVDSVLFAFLIFSFLSILFSQFQLISFLTFLKFARIIMIFFLVRSLLKELRLANLIPLILAVSLLFQGAWTSLQFFFQKPLGRAIEHLGYLAAGEKTFFRAQGTFGHPNVLASFLVILFCFSLIQIFNPKQTKFSKKVLSLSFIVGSLGLVFTFSRAAWMVTLIIGVLALLFLRHYGKLIFDFLLRKWLTSIAFLAMIFFPLLILPRLSQLYSALSEYGVAFYRVYLLEKAWFLAQESPLGIGLSTFPAVLIQRFGFFTWPAPVHNIFLGILVEAGVLSLMFFLIFLILAYKRFFFDILRVKNNLFFLKTAAFFATLGYLGGASFYSFSWDSKIFELFWLFLGIMLY